MGVKIEDNANSAPTELELELGLNLATYTLHMIGGNVGDMWYFPGGEDDTDDYPSKVRIFVNETKPNLQTNQTLVYPQF